jgi:hypothetical protein
VSPEIPETVPSTLTLVEIANSRRPFPLPIAVQVFRNSGIEKIDISSGKSDILRILGTPDKSGGGDDSPNGFPEWFRYNRHQCIIDFHFDGESIRTVTFSPAFSFG